MNSVYFECVAFIGNFRHHESMNGISFFAIFEGKLRTVIPEITITCEMIGKIN